MLRGWTILSVLALLAVLASGIDRLRLEPAGCDGMSAAMGMDDCHSRRVGDDGAAIPDCATYVCIAAQTALPTDEWSPRTLAFSALSAQAAPHDDMNVRGLRGPPDLRPPIA